MPGDKRSRFVSERQSLTFTPHSAFLSVFQRRLTADVRLEGHPDRAERRVCRGGDRPRAPSPMTREEAEDQNRSLDAYA